MVTTRPIDKDRFLEAGIKKSPANKILIQVCKQWLKFPLLVQEM